MIPLGVQTYTGVDAGRVLARLQSILLNERKMEGRSYSDGEFFSSTQSDVFSLLGDGLGVAGTIAGWIPRKKSKAISVKIENNSDYVLIPTRFHSDDLYYSVKKNMGICESNNETDIEIETVGKYKPEKARFVITFSLSEKNSDPIKLELNIETNEGKVWIIRKYVYSTVKGDHYYTDNNNGDSRVLTLARFNHAEKNFPSVAVACYSTTSAVDESRIKITILPWRQDADLASKQEV